ncbi:MAG: hypothetical protein RIR09_2505 [Pseudomonadota bacterium]
MSDGVELDQGNTPVAVNLTQSLTAGRMLRNAREAVGLHVGALAVSMKIPVKKLEALESDRFDLLPDAAFVRALASSVCRTLKIDAAPILEKLPLSHVPQLGPGNRAVNEPFYAYGKSGVLSFSGLLSKPTVIWVLVLLTASITVFFLPELQKQFLNHVDKTTVDVAVPSLAPVELGNASQNMAPTPDSSIGNKSGALPAQIPVSQAAPLGATMSVSEPSEVEAADTAPPAGVVLNEPAAQLLGLKARGPTWVKVVDAKGTVQLMKILVAGEAALVGGVAPLSVVVGSADSLDVMVRGEPFELRTLARDNVARFEVK